MTELASHAEADWVELSTFEAASRMGISVGALCARLRYYEDNGGVAVLRNGITGVRDGPNHWRVRFPTNFTQQPLPDSPEPEALVPSTRAFRRRYAAFSELVRVLAAGETHQLPRLIDEDNPLRKLDVEQILTRLVQYGACTKLGDTVTGTKRAKKLLSDELAFCSVLECDASHADNMMAAISLFESGATPEEKAAGIFLELYDYLGEKALRARLGISKFPAYRYRAWGILSPEARRAMRKHGLGVTYAYAVWKHAVAHDSASELEVIELMASTGLDIRSAEYSSTEALRQRAVEYAAERVEPEPEDDLEIDEEHDGDPAGGGGDRGGVITDADESESDPNMLAIVEANLKVTMALLDLLRKINTKVDFLVKELGYQEKPNEKAQ